MDAFYLSLVSPAGASLMEKTADFNRSAHRPDPAVLADLPEERREEILSLLNARLKERPFLRRSWPSADDFADFWDFSFEPRRLMLLDDPTFEALILRFGAAVWAPKLGRIVDRADVAQVKKELGELHGYVTGQGRLALGELRTPFLSGRTPLTRQGLGRSGLLAVNLCWSPLPPELAARRPERLVEPEALSALPASEVFRKKLFDKLKRMLTKEVAPPWRNCFASMV
ncbi:MAG: hypothetical protein LBJ64_05240 [Deltaproteobacteria bacterium]|jgi:hypothetical protein|nr:hypothetical protein [Deltaproteobacteria bacterium]